jgi:hypothetical protein
MVQKYFICKDGSQKIRAKEGRTLMEKKHYNGGWKSRCNQHLVTGKPTHTRISKLGESTLRASHFSPKKVMYNEYNSTY